MVYNVPDNKRELNTKQKSLSILSNLPNAMVIIDENMTVLSANEPLYQLLGYLPEEINGLQIKSILHPANVVSFCGDIQNALCDSILSPTVYRIRDKQGVYAWCECSFVKLLSGSYVEGIAIILQDVSAYINTETQLKAQNEELIQINEQLNKFVYGVSHDLRAPLSSILGIVNYSELDVTDTEVLKSFSLIKASVTKLDKFIRDVLDYSKNLKSETNVEKIDFNVLIEDVLSNIKYMNATEANITVKSFVDCNLDFFSDQNRLNIVLSNLISNALRYYNPQTADPFVEIEVSILDNNAHIVIRDNGIGISVANQKKIFDMFYRVSTNSSGSGLGLYIVKDTVSKLNGSIEVKSELGKGTIFEVEVPNLKAEDRGLR